MYRLDSNSYFYSSLLIIGALTSSYVAWRLLCFVYLYGIRRSLLPRYLHGRRHYAWALVTGASDGIGKQLAGKLAHAGFNVILHGRNQAKLERVAVDIRKQYPSAKVRTVVANADTPGKVVESVENITTSLQDLGGPLTVLLNNVGGGEVESKVYGPLADWTGAQADALIDRNARFAAHLTRELMPFLLKSQPALISNVLSAVAILPGPYLPFYSGAKGFMLAFSQVLSRDQVAEGTDVEVLGHIVARVTGAAGVDEPESFLNPTAEAVAESILARTGCGQMVVTSHWRHAIALALTSALPERMVTRVLIDSIRPLKQQHEAAMKSK